MLILTYGDFIVRLKNKCKKMAFFVVFRSNKNFTRFYNYEHYFYERKMLLRNGLAETIFEQIRHSLSYCVCQNGRHEKIKVSLSL